MIELISDTFRPGHRLLDLCAWCREKSLAIIPEIIIFFMALLLAAGCSSQKAEIRSLAASSQPLFTIGDEGSGHYYTWIGYFAVENGLIFAWDKVRGEQIDAYDKNGNFLFSFGRKGQGPGEFQAIGCLAVDPQGDIWVSSSFGRPLEIFTADGHFKNELRLPANLSGLFIDKISFDREGNLYLLGGNEEKKILIYKYDSQRNHSQLIYEQKEGHGSSIATFIPDFALDEAGNIYITDSFDYLVYKYSKDGKLVKTFKGKKIKKELITEQDFNVFDNDMKIIRFPNSERILQELKGPSRYFPAIFGLNIDDGKIYVWTGQRDDKKRYIVDVYDLNFSQLGQACYFNFIRYNLAQIMDGRLYIAYIENYDLEVMKQLSRICLSNTADKLNVYSINGVGPADIIHNQ
ncbi:MAG TPA: 6-bladed beta-propeller [Candidatus Saccharicenans sp.]|nr:6-bladed beta-propeller [Candidatus Saccharicenans sp.]HRD02306.1 6-bladed beta-propeller [Candidatus Saccharicenans sp.]